MTIPIEYSTWKIKPLSYIGTNRSFLKYLSHLLSNTHQSRRVYSQFYGVSHTLGNLLLFRINFFFIKIWFLEIHLRYHHTLIFHFYLPPLLHKYCRSRWQEYDWSFNHTIFHFSQSIFVDFFKTAINKNLWFPQ